MSRIARAPPVVGLALAAASGAMVLHLGVPLPWTLPLLLLFLVPHATSRRPRSRFLLWKAVGLAFLSGAFFTHVHLRKTLEDCRYHLSDGRPLVVRGSVRGRVVARRGEIVPDSAGKGCDRPLRFVLAGGHDDGDGQLDELHGDVRPGDAVVLHGSWRKGNPAKGASPLRAGYLRVDSIGSTGATSGLRHLPSRVQGRVQRRLAALFPGQRALAEALVLARKEGLSREVRDAFARAGTAHLLAISGFHVGVVAGLLLLLLGSFGLGHAHRFVLASGGVWAYVLGIGAPDAAVRAAMILTLLALGRVVRRPMVSLGVLATAFLLFVLLDPGGLTRAGFQLSFAGALGLVLWARSLTGWMRAKAGIGASIPGSGSSLLPWSMADGLGAGVAATLATLPLVAWHFGRISLVGIPITLLATPLVTLAIPGIFASLLLSFLHPALGGFLARGVELDLALLSKLVRAAAGLPWASAWISRPAVIAGVGAAVLAFFGLRALSDLRRPARLVLLGLTLATGIVTAPLVTRAHARGTMELVVLDVGQGDAILLRSPADRWVAVDAGPRTNGYDVGERVVAPYLRRRGVRRLEALLLTHGDMDHVGGARAVLEGVPVRTVLDPGRALGTDVFIGVLETAERKGVAWRTLTAGDSLNLDGVALRVVSPDSLTPTPDANASSLVLELRFGDFGALLTGDAPVEQEEAFLPRIHSSTIQVLKVGHHGSRTSTSAELLERLRPEVAILSVGRRNRFGHPHPEVLAALGESGTEIHRTDRDGRLVIVARKDGGYRLSPGRGP